VRAMSPLISVGSGRSRSKRGRSLRPAIALQAGAADAVADLAARGLPVAVLSGSMAAHYRGRVTARTVDDVVTPALLALIWKNTHSPGKRELLAPHPASNHQARPPPLPREPAGSAPDHQDDRS
jgi:DNA-binding transcriptional LysR family regulator